MNARNAADGRAGTPVAVSGGAAPRAARSRLRTAVLLLATVALALLSRRHPLPGVLAEHTGDAGYAIAAFFAFVLARPAARARSLAVAAFAFSAVVEFSQLWRPAWLVDLRGTTIGALLLGQGFQWADLLAYAIGALIAWGIDAVAGPRPGP